jgi:hypothetical protein
MLILSAANREEVLDVVAQDPFKIEGLVYELTVAGEICSDTLLRSGEISHAAPDPVTIAVAHGIKH